MPRRLRTATGGFVYHVLNRAVGRARLFRKERDYAAFEKSEGPVQRRRYWLAYVNASASEAELKALRRSVVRGAPYGGEAWQRRTAKRLGLESTLRPGGRPTKKYWHHGYT